MSHNWTENDERLLGAAMANLAPMRDVLHRQKNADHMDWWAMVAGTLFQMDDIRVTPNACRYRAYLIGKRESARSSFDRDNVTVEEYLSDTESIDGWNRTMDVVFEWEADWHDRTSADLEEVVQRTRRIEALTSALAREWGVEPPDVPGLVVITQHSTARCTCPACGRPHEYLGGGNGLAKTDG